MPLLPSARVPSNTILPDALIATFWNDENPLGDVAATAVNGPPLPKKIPAGSPRCANTAENATVPEALMHGDPRTRPTKPDAVESTINLKDFPSPLKIARELLAVVASNATIPAGLIDTSAPNEFKAS